MDHNFSWFCFIVYLDNKHNVFILIHQHYANNGNDLEFCSPIRVMFEYWLIAILSHFDLSDKNTNLTTANTTIKTSHVSSAPSQ